MSRFSSSRTFSRPDSWQLRIAASKPGQTVAVWGCGPVGQFAIRSAFLLGAGRVIALDNVPERLELARKGGAETLNDEDKDVQEKLRSMTSGRGPDHCIDAVGMEAHGATLDAAL